MAARLLLASKGGWWAYDRTVRARANTSTATSDNVSTCSTDSHHHLVDLREGEEGLEAVAALMSEGLMSRDGGCRRKFGTGLRTRAGNLALDLCKAASPLSSTEPTGSGCIRIRRCGGCGGR